MSKLTALGHAGLAFETTYGTSVAPTVWLPYETIKVEDDIKKVTDDGRRATLAKDFGVYNTVTSSKTELDFQAYPDTLGYLLKAILGQDTVTGASAPYTHTFKLVNSLAPSVTISDYNTVTERQYAGSILDELTLKFDTEGAMKASAKFQGKASVTGSVSTPTFTTLNPFLGYQLALTLNGSANVNVVGGEFHIKRENKLIFGANNTQQPTKYSTGRLEVGGKLTFDVEDESEWLLFANGTQPAISLLFTQNANTTLTLSCGKIDITKAHIDRSQEFLRVDMDYKAVWNATDAPGATTITLKNAVATY